MSNSTLLRYIGGKSALVPDIAPYIRVPHTGVYYEPFFGGGSVGLAVASTTAYKNIHIVINDYDEEVANFWKQVVNPNKAEVTDILNRIRAARPSLDLFDKIKAWSPTDPVDRAFRFLFLNRASHVASFNKRPLGGRKQPNPDSDIKSRFNSGNIIEEFIRARRLLLGRTTVYNLDFADVMNQAASDWVIYADPPYYDRNLYDVSFSVNDHFRLRGLLTTTPADWVLSYQEHPAVLDLYKAAQINVVPTNHSMHKRERNELIIVPKR